MLTKLKRIIGKGTTEQILTHPIGSYECCVVCHELTNVSKFTPIDQRPCYVPGCGQLCEDCCSDIYGTTDLRTKSVLE